MTAISIHIGKSEASRSRFRAIAGNHQSVGRTMGEALDALTANWGDTFKEAEVRIEPLLEEKEEAEPHLIEINGVCVFAGGSLPPDHAPRDFIEVMREERIRSFFPPSTL